MSNILEIKNLNYKYDKTTIFKNFNLTVKENLRFIAALYGFGKEEAALKSEAFMEKFHLKDRAEDKAKLLSGGLQRRLSIAMALITEPEIVFLDEPTLGLDVKARRELWKIIEELKGGDVTVILTTHYLEEAEKLSDRIAVMQNGKLAAISPRIRLYTSMPSFTNPKRISSSFARCPL